MFNNLPTSHPIFPPDSTTIATQMAKTITTILSNYTKITIITVLIVRAKNSNNNNNLANNNNKFLTFTTNLPPPKITPHPTS